ncbi:YcbK family protein [Mesorhizobium marinum]|uniref:YcbK family protein n=1 Tax=Mesorhizobium marinum TaxID=3228790 RepID=UPI003464EDBF
MKARARLTGGRRSTAALAALLAVLVASCSSTTEPSMEFAQTDAGAPAVDLEAVAASETGAARTGASAAATVPQIKPDAKAAASAQPPKEEAKPVEATLAAAKAKPEPTATAAAALAPSPTGQVLENGGPILTAGTMPSQPIAPKKKSFLSSFFGSTPADAKPVVAAAPRQAKPVIALPDPNEEKRKKDAAVRFASLGAADDGVDSGDGDFALPGVRKTNLFEIKRKSGIDDDSDIDVYEDVGTYDVASAAGLARLAPNGLLKQRESVDTACLKPKLVRMLKQVERHFGKRLVVTSGYRSPAYNKRVRGAEKSQHMYCAAVDVQMPGVNKWELARYVRAMPGRGGVGTYCHQSIHIDIGPERDWNWKCGGRKT